MGDGAGDSYGIIKDQSSNSNNGTLTNMDENDVSQMMVAGYDLGAFESSSEELSGEQLLDTGFDTDTSSSTTGTYWTTNGWVISGGKATLDGSTGVTGNQTIFQSTANSGVLVDPAIVGRIYRVTGTLTVTSWHGSDYLDASNVNGNNVILVRDTDGVGTHSFDTLYVANDDQWGFRVVGTNTNTNLSLDNVSVKEVLQSEVSDTHPAIIDVNEPVLGAELIISNTTSDWTTYGGQIVKQILQMVYS